MDWRTAFVGREREIASVRALIERNRLLTLTGAGGIGKSRLAVEAIRPAPGDFQGRVVIVELAPLRDHRQLLPAIGAAIGMRESSVTDPLHVLAELMGRTPTLLLLDNFEHITPAAPHVADLLNAAPSLRVLVTSRVPLHLSGEQEYPVPPLEIPASGQPSEEELSSIDAVILFAERAARVRPDFEIDPSNALAVAEICRRLDGLPLAIELAAARLKVLSPDALLRRLSQRLDVLTGGAADLPERHRTLRATIAWSYELMGERERSVQLRCAVFAGGFSLDAAQAITPADDDSLPLLDVLATLVDHNLLVASPGADGEPRFRMLETIREFALDEMDPEAYRDARRRHAGYYVDLAENAAAGLQGPEHLRWLEWFGAELDNIRVALDWLVEDEDADQLARMTAAMAPYWRYYGAIREGQERLRAAVGVAPKASLLPRARALRAAGWLEVVAGNLAPGQRLLEKALSLFEEIGDGSELATTLYHLGSCLADREQWAPARSRFEEGLGWAQRAGADATEGRILGGLAAVAGASGDSADAIEYARLGIDASRRAGDKQRLGLLYNVLAWNAWDDGDASAALRYWADAVQFLRDWDERAFLGSFLLIAGRAHWRSGDPETARVHLREGIQLVRQVGALPDVVAALAETAEWLNAIGNTDRAIFHLQTAGEILEAHGVSPHLSFPFAEARANLREAMSAPRRSTRRSGEPVSIEQALDDAEADVASAEIRQTPPAIRSRGSSFELTPREREVLQLIVAGRSNAEIGEALFISRKTASVHVANIKDKLGASSRVGIVTIALASNLSGAPGEAV